MQYSTGRRLLIANILLFQHLFLGLRVGQSLHELRIFLQLLLSVVPQLPEQSDLEQIFFYFMKQVPLMILDCIYSTLYLVRDYGTFTGKEGILPLNAMLNSD